MIILPFDEAKKAVVKMNIVSATDYKMRYCEYKKLPDTGYSLPSSPKLAYSEEFVSWSDFFEH